MKYLPNKDNLYFFFTIFYNNIGGSMKDKKYYKYLDILRIFSCIAVFLYHLGYLKGGYLAVCSFFVLSGYFAYTSASKKEKFSFLDYYKDRFLHIYLPYLIVVLITVGVIQFFPNISWLNLKPETTSALLGYNNFWQLQANLDYFARHINSPFMHFWYMAILLQFELVFPLLYYLLNKTGEKNKKYLPCIILGILTIVSTSYFIYQGVVFKNQMILYYHTLTRIFSLFFGLFIGAIHSYYHPLLFKKIDARIGFFFYFILLILSCIFIGAESHLFILSMILVTIITGRMISYGTAISQNKLSTSNKILKCFSKITYEIYLVQYPVIFIFQMIFSNEKINAPLIIIITILLACILHFALENKSGKFKFLQIITIILITLLTSFGFYHYILAKDYTAEMKLLEEQLNQNEKEMEEKQKEYAKKLKLEEDQLNSALAEIEGNESDLENYIHQLPIIGIGDSVMLGALPSLYEEFPNGYFDAKVSRTDYEANRILQDIKNQGFLGNPIVMSLGTNGQCGARCQDDILSTIGERELFWINVVNDASVHVNAGLNRLATNYSNVHIVDWANASNGHSEYFVADGIHLTESGKVAFSKTLYDTIYQNYKQQIAAKKEQLLKEYENNLNYKIAFYGNDLLIKAYDSLQTEFSDYELEFHAKKEQKIEEMVKEIKENSKNNSSAKNIVLFLEPNIRLNKEDYKILESLPSYVYLVSTNSISYTSANINILDFSKEIKNHDTYLMIDKVHLSEEGNKALANELLNIIKDKIKFN